MRKLKSICAVLSLQIPFALFAQSPLIGPPINTTEMYEFNPCLSGNGRTMIFESSFSATDRPILEISYQKNGTWTNREEVTGAFHTITSLSSNGGFFLNNNSNILLFHSKLPKSEGSFDIWIMEKNALGTWTKAQNIGAPINSTAAEMDASISADGKYLFFTRISSKDKTPEGNPCGKLFVAENTGKEWKAPVLMPAPINMGCECAGRMLADNKTFLFASMRAGGLGGYDIYKTVQKSDGSWEEPLPYSFINTSKDDKYVSVPAEGSTIYSTGTEKKGSLDVVKTKIPDDLQPEKTTLVQGNIKNAANNPILSTKIIVTNTTTNKSNIYIGAKDGSYTFSVPQDKDVYDVAILSNEIHSFKSMLFFPPKTNPKYEEKTIPIQLLHLKAGMVLPLPNIAFVNNSDSLQSYSILEVTRIYNMLKSNITMRIEIGVHTNDAKNDNTSNQAHAIANILIKKGIPVERVIPKGYGNSQPLNPAPTDLFQNKRVEFKIIHH
jgi:OOP family OmpA-OmpF porin